MTDRTPQPRIPFAAWLSLLLGLAAVPLFVLAIPALLIGLLTLRTINGSEGSLRGEGLVKVGLISAVFGLVLSAVGVLAVIVIELQSRSKRVECMNHLREIGLALNKHADARETFPPATRVPAELPPDQRLSWFADVLPWLAEGNRVAEAYQTLSSRIDQEHGWNDPANAEALAARIRMFHCPGNEEPITNATFYVGLTGINPKAIDLKRDDPRAGVFGNDRGIQRKDVTSGISFTMMVMETAHENGPWLAGGFPTARGLDPEVKWYSGPGRPFGGLHRGVVQVLWVDGAVRPLANSTPAEQFQKQVTIRRETP